MSAMMLTLGRPAESAEARLDLPASREEIERVRSALDEYAEDAGKPIVIQDAGCEVPGIYQYICWANIEEPSDIQKLNQLAESISRMDRRECAIFAGALDAESINGLDDVLTVADRLDGYVFLPNISTDQELGRFLVDTGYKNFPENVRPYLDYKAIGAEYYAEHGGAYGPCGYVCRKNSMGQISERRTALITLHMLTQKVAETMSEPFRLPLPATDDELDRAKAELDVDYFTEVTIVRIEFGGPRLEELIPQDGFCVEDANELALSLEKMQQNDSEFSKYLAVLSVMQPETLTGALRLATALDDFEFCPNDPEQYGRNAADYLRSDVDALLEELEGYIDYSAFGEQQMLADGVRPTAYGNLRRLSAPLPEEQEFGQAMM